MAKRIVTLDFTEHDTVHLLNMLLKMCEQGEVTGILYAVALRKNKTHTVYCGATGRLADDPIAGAGFAAMLATKLSQEAIERSTRLK